MHFIEVRVMRNTKELNMCPCLTNDNDDHWLDNGCTFPQIPKCVLYDKSNCSICHIKKTAVTVCHQSRHCLSLSCYSRQLCNPQQTQSRTGNQVLGMSSVSRTQIYVFPWLNKPPHGLCQWGSAKTVQDSC